ncbi:hypothetical protein KPL70_001464 [Citrus sinensis]|nr:hypothetical protein KPL70_001464 [Citrus sinensis]
MFYRVEGPWVKTYGLILVLTEWLQDNNYLECFNGENMPKQSSSFSSPREIKGSSSPEVLEEELATDVSDLVARSCCITLKYSSSVLALAKRDWALDFWVRKVCWALECLMVGSRNPLAESQFRIKVSKTSQKLVQESKSNFAKAIREQLDRIEATSSSSSKVQIAPDTPQSSKIGILEHDNMSIASYDLEAFKDEPTPKANKIHWELALPTAKSPLDLTIDNRPSALIRCRSYPDSNHIPPFHRLFLRDDANHITWKEKFLAGLPTLLGEKVRNFIKALYDNRIPYDELTYANTVILKPIQWKDVNLPEEWILEGAAPPAILKQLEPNTELQNMTQYSDGRVKLSFRRSTSSRFSDKESCSSIPSLERKFTKVPSVINLPYQTVKSQPRFSTSDVPSSSIRSVDYTTSVPHSIYTSNQHEQRQEKKEPSPPTSPTFSAITENQLTRIENQFQKSTIAISSISHVPSKSDFDKKHKEPTFKPFQVSKTSQKLVQESKSNFAKAIREQLDRIEVASSSSSKVQIVPDTPQSSKIGVLEQDQMSIASSDIEAFTEEPVSKANKIHWELALPTVKSPPDLTIDNRPSALNQSRYNASSVYEGNIDGMSEYNILGLLQQMTMAANAYKIQSGTSDKAIAEILIAGFTGQLKGW